MADRPTSASKAWTYAETSRFLMLASRTEEAVEVGRQGLALAKELGLRELQASALNNIGTARADAGDLEGLTDLDEAFAIAEAINSPRRCARSATRRRSRASSATSDARASSTSTWSTSRDGWESVASCGGARSSPRSSTITPATGTSRWSRRETFLATIDEAHYMEPIARQVRAETMVGRGDAERAVAESQLAVEFARSAKDPQVLYPTMAVHAHLLVLAGRPSVAGELADELIALVADQKSRNDGRLYASPLDELGRPRMQSNSSGLAVPTRWREAALRTRAATGWVRRTSSATSGTARMRHTRDFVPRKRAGQPSRATLPSSSTVGWARRRTSGGSRRCCRRLPDRLRKSAVRVQAPVTGTINLRGENLLDKGSPAGFDRAGLP